MVCQDQKLGALQQKDCFFLVEPWIPERDRISQPHAGVGGRKISPQVENTVCKSENNLNPGLIAFCVLSARDSLSPSRLPLPPPFYVCGDIFRQHLRLTSDSPALWQVNLRRTTGLGSVLLVCGRRTQTVIQRLFILLKWFGIYE